MITEEEKDDLFLTDYNALCKKYSRCVDIVEIDEVGVIRSEFAFCGDLSTPAEREQKRIEFQRLEAELEAQQEKERLIEREKIIKAHVDRGGKLDENGNIPIPDNYCQVIDLCNALKDRMRLF